VKFKNQVANKIAGRMANDKKMKMQLMQELDSIKDRFSEWQTSMRCQELDQDISHAANFLAE
jgi:ferredoxin-thioredoxin reductase catalytic subunit